MAQKRLPQHTEKNSQASANHHDTAKQPEDKTAGSSGSVSKLRVEKVGLHHRDTERAQRSSNLRAISVLSPVSVVKNQLALLSTSN
jgi:hypothetical protein